MNNSEHLKDIVATLKAERIKLGLSQKNVAEELGLTQTYLSQLETGKKPRFSTAILVRYANTLNIPIPVLLWKSLTEDKISEEKKEIFRQLKPSIDELIRTVYA